jgi:prepilin-type N-terminal cleavage/methylation domain-containing protein/prepilin-type processing-associated H-X9-DG protein
MKHPDSSPNSPFPRPGACGFSLTELLVVIVIVVVLATVIFTFAKRARDSAHDARCTSNLRQIAALMTAAAAENGGTYPRKAYANGYRGGGERFAPEHFMLGYEGFLKDSSGNFIERAAPPSECLFNCPAEKSPKDAFGNDWFQSHYGFNFYLVHTTAMEMEGANGTNPCRAPISSIQNPERVFLVGDSSNCYSIAEQPNRVAFRHAGKKKWNVAFVDGHVESRTKGQSAFGWMQYIPWGGTYPAPQN